MLRIPTIAIEWSQLTSNLWEGFIYLDMLTPGAFESLHKHIDNLALIGRDGKDVLFEHDGSGVFTSKKYTTNVRVFIKDKKPFNEEATYF